MHSGLEYRENRIASACPLCGSEITSIESADGLRELFGCHASSGEHWHRWVVRKQAAPALPSQWSQIIIPEPLASFNAVEKCFNGPCQGLLEIKQGRAYCRRCGVHQRIVE